MHVFLIIINSYIFTRNRFLPPVPATEAGDSTGDDHHKTDADGSDYQKELEVDLTVFASEPSIAVTRDLRAVQDALTVPVAELALRTGPGADPAWEETGRGDVQVAGHAAAVVGALGVCTDSLVGAVVVFPARAFIKVIYCNSRDHYVRAKRKLRVFDSWLNQGSNSFLFFLAPYILIRNLNKKFNLHVFISFSVSIINVVVQFKVPFCVVVYFDRCDLRMMI